MGFSVRLGTAMIAIATLGAACSSGGNACPVITGGAAGGTAGGSRSGGAMGGSDAAGGSADPGTKAPDPWGPWACLGQVTWPAPSSAHVTVTLNLVDLITAQPIEGLPGRVCHKLDTTCATPLIIDLLSDSSGRMVFQTSAGFDGYLELSGGSMVPSLYFFYPPVTGDRVVPAIPIMQNTTLAAFAQLAGGEVKADRGHVMVRAYNCMDTTAEGVFFSSLESDDATIPFYMVKGIPSTKQSSTDSSGYGGLFNLPPGSLTLIGQLDDGRAMGQLGVMTRPGQISYTNLVPAPR